MEQKPYKFKDKLSEGINKLQNQKFSNTQLLAIFVVFIIIAIILGLIINSAVSRNKADKKASSETFVQENITFSRKKDNLSRGSVVIFNRENALKGYLIKRVIAVGGDKVHIDSDGYVYINDERYQTYHSYFQKDVEMPLTVPDGKLFVLGDNGDASADSRSSYIGFIDVNELEGIAIQ